MSVPREGKPGIVTLRYAEREGFGSKELKVPGAVVHNNRVSGPEKESGPLARFHFPQNGTSYLFRM